MAAVLSLPIAPCRNRAPVPGIVVLQEIFGVKQNLYGGFAANGYIAVVPDLFWRIEPGIQLTGKSQEE